MNRAREKSGSTTNPTSESTRKSVPIASNSRGRWMALVAALLGWMFDGFEIGMFPLVGRPALAELLGGSATAGIEKAADVTGWLGGYNFQWAWASAFACAQALRPDA